MMSESAKEKWFKVGMAIVTVIAIPWCIYVTMGVITFASSLSEVRTHSDQSVFKLRTDSQRELRDLRSESEIARLTMANDMKDRLIENNIRTDKALESISKSLATMSTEIAIVRTQLQEREKKQ